MNIRASSNACPTCGTRRSFIVDIESRDETEAENVLIRDLSRDKENLVAMLIRTMRKLPKDDSHRKIVMDFLGRIPNAIGSPLREKNK